MSFYFPCTLHSSINRTASTAQHSTAQHSTAQHSTAQRGSALRGTACSAAVSPFQPTYTQRTSSKQALCSDQRGRHTHNYSPSRIAAAGVRCFVQLSTARLYGDTKGVRFSSAAHCNNTQRLGEGASSAVASSSRASDFMHGMGSCRPSSQTPCTESSAIDVSKLSPQLRCGRWVLTIVVLMALQPCMLCNSTHRFIESMHSHLLQSTVHRSCRSVYG